LSIEWSLFDVNFLFEQLCNEDLNSALIISQICGFPNIDIIDKHPADIEKGFNYYLQKTYPLNNDESNNIAVNFSNEIPHSTIDDQIKRGRQYAIDEVSRDLIKCSQAFISRSQNCPKFLLSSDFLPERSISDLTNHNPFAIKCKRPIDNIGTSNRENDHISIAAQELFNDWVIGQKLKEYDYRFFDEVENLTNMSTTPLGTLKKNQEEALFSETLEMKNPVIEDITGYEFSNVITNKTLIQVESSLNISQSTLDTSEDIHQDTSLEKPKKKSRRSGFR
jgi:hypothetical protein